jgi:hypothetical protein
MFSMKSKARRNLKVSLVTLHEEGVEEDCHDEGRT